MVFLSFARPDFINGTESWWSCTRDSVAHALLRAAFTPSKTLRSGMARVDRRELNLKTEFAKFGG
jgi:hypothetical protein